MNVPRGNAAVLTQAQGATDEEPLAEKEQFETAVRSLRIQDYGLFVDPS